MIVNPPLKASFRRLAGDQRRVGTVSKTPRKNFFLFKQNCFKSKNVVHCYTVKERFL